MVNPVLRPCVSCGAPVETRRMTSTPTCSTKCYQRVRRERLEQESTMDIQFGNITVRILNVRPDINHDSLRARVVELLGPEMMTALTEMEVAQ